MNARAEALRDFLRRLEASAGYSTVENFLAHNPDLEAMAEEKTTPDTGTAVTPGPGPDVPALLAEVNRLRARVAELERPAIEAKRNEIRQSYIDLAAQAREDRDYEGSFNVFCSLREREEQWALEDAASNGGAQ